MKKIYASIFAALLCTTAMAQEEEHALSFVRNGQVLQSGATVTISEVEYTDLGGEYVIEMDPQLYVRNNDSNYNVTAVCEADGLGENYGEIEFCFGECKSWIEGSTHLSNAHDLLPGEDFKAFIHIGFKFVTEKNYVISDAGVKLTLYPDIDPDDAVTLTLRFDTTGASVKTLTEHKSIEVYNLCGKKIATSTVGLNKGIYIIKQGGISRKVTIK